VLNAGDEGVSARFGIGGRLHKAQKIGEELSCGDGSGW
jgi:hypothetical protein